MAYALVLHIFLNGLPGMVVRDAIEGAARRLATPTWQSLFVEYMDRSGHTLAENLAGLGKTPVEQLSSVYFVDGDRMVQCARDQSTAAFTEPGSRVVYVCGGRFAERFARKTAGGELLLIHELLHSLGLGENPPTSEQITDRVRTRCGD